MSAIPKDANTEATTSTFITALVTNLVLLSAEVAVFLILKHRFGRIYSPRTYLPPPEKRSEVLPSGVWRWIPALLQEPLENVVHKNGLDAYMHLRFIKLLFYIFLFFSVSTMLILVPDYTVGVHNGRTGLDRITWSNLTGETSTVARFSAHVVLAYVLTIFVIFMIRREMLHFVHMRHNFLISHSYSKLAQARTVLITSVPNELATEHDLLQFASFVPGGVDRVWMYRDTKALNELFEDRQDACKKLEAAESQFLRKIVKSWRKRCAHQERKETDEEEQSNLDEILASKKELLDELAFRGRRPTHKTGLLGLIGEKVDSIDWYKKEISRLNISIKEARAHVVRGKFLGSAFVRCNLQIGAHVLAQCVSFHEPDTMYHKWMEANPKDIVWSNLDDGYLESNARYVTSWIATIGLIAAWTIPVAFIGGLSNLDDVCRTTPWLKWICTVPRTGFEIIQGVLPPLLLGILFAILPFILKALAWYECIPRYSLISLAVYKRFFLFLLFHGFIVVTLTSGLVAAIENILNNPAKTIQQLANKLPDASTFFLTYMVTQGLAGAGMALIQLVPLFLHFIKKWFFGRTPRQAYAVTFLMPSADFGLLLPRLSLLAVVGFAYSVISPFINILATITYAMYFCAWKFLLTQVFDQPDEGETGGLYFPLAISNLFVGLYVEQISLAALFFLKISDRTAFLGEAIAMIVLLAITILAHISTERSFKPITNYLPMSLATKKMAKKFAKEKQKHPGLLLTGNDSLPDLFSKRNIKNLRRRMKKVPKKLEAGIGELKAKLTRESNDGRSSADHGRSFETDRSGHSTVEQPEKANGHDHHQTKDEASVRVSRSSSRSSKSKKKSKRRKSSLDVPRPPEIHISDADDSSDDDDDQYNDDRHAFDHPSTYVEQPWIWIPTDPFGFSEMLVADLKEAGVEAGNDGAIMDKRGVVEVSRSPPDEGWSGGHDR